MTGLRLGSGRLTARFGTSDPIAPAAVASMRIAADEALRESPDVAPRDIVAVGGTASNLLKLTADGIEGAD